MAHAMDCFNDDFRKMLAGLCASFIRVPYSAGDAAPLKRAAVAITVVAGDRGRPAFLLTRRATTLRAHAGQWALPGGRCDGDETAIEGALRELREELGLALGAPDLLGLLDEYPTRSGYLITPVVLWGHASRPIVPNAAEVSAVYRVPLAQILRDDAVEFITAPDSGRPLVRVLMNGVWVNAPTAAIVYQFREMLLGRETRVADFEQPAFAWR
jgi:8-oxo-dGTP pyrophosphatase MutT (NUDIX family)